MRRIALISAAVLVALSFSGAAFAGECCDKAKAGDAYSCGPGYFAGLASRAAASPRLSVRDSRCRFSAIRKRCELVPRRCFGSCSACVMGTKTGQYAYERSASELRNHPEPRRLGSIDCQETSNETCVHASIGPIADARNGRDPLRGREEVL